MFTAKVSFEAMGRLLKAQGWALTGVIVAGLTFYPLAASWAQSDPRVAANPLLVELERRDPGMLASVLTKLEPLKTGTVRAGSRVPDPIPAELAQIKENPDFAIAYAHNPDKTLGLLRAINGFLH